LEERGLAEEIQIVSVRMRGVAEPLAGLARVGPLVIEAADGAGVVVDGALGGFADAV
jgi:hypothetical protein